MTAKFLSAAAIAALAGACAPPPSGGPAAGGPMQTAAMRGDQADCFNVNFINSYSEVDRDTVRVRVGVNDYYDLDVSPACYDLEWSNRIGVMSEFGSNMCVGRGFGQGTVVTEEDRCTVLQVSHAPVPPADGDMTPYSPAESGN